MNLETPAVVHLNQTNPATVTALTTTGPVIPDPAVTKEVPEASTWILLLVATGLWLLRLRKRQGRGSSLR